MSVALRGAAGFDIFNVHDFYFGLQSMTTNQLTTAYSKNAHITTGKNVITDYFIEPGDYLKIDNVTLGYTVCFSVYFRITSKFLIKDDYENNKIYHWIRDNGRYSH